MSGDRGDGASLGLMGTDTIPSAETSPHGLVEQSDRRRV